MKPLSLEEWLKEILREYIRMDLLPSIVVSGIIGVLLGFIVRSLGKVAIGLVILLVILVVVGGFDVSYPDMGTMFSMATSYLTPLYELILTGLPWSAVAFGLGCLVGLTGFNVRVGRP